jgi:molybdopterin/thiamine biosynthesis adenylyltransferase
MPAKRRKVVVVGAGNIGSAALALLGRNPMVSHVVVIDHDTYEAKNAASQDIDPIADAGQPKAIAAERRLKAIRPNGDLLVTPVVDLVQNVPLGMMRADVIVGCLDSRLARQAINRIAFRLGVPLIDTGVSADEMLARMSLHVPGRRASCLECSWSERDYELIEHQYGCDGQLSSAPSTGAPAALGALAASLAALECQKLMAGGPGQWIVGKKILLSAAWHRHYVTDVPHNRACKFDHLTWGIEHVRSMRTVRDLVRLVRPSSNAGASISIGLEGRHWIRQLQCPDCGRQRETLCMEGRLPERLATCRCGRAMMAMGALCPSRLALAELEDARPDRPIESIGLRKLDVLSISNGQRDRHVQIGTAPTAH